MNYSGALSAIQQYKKLGVSSDIDSASPHRLIQMLMEGALEKISLAKSYMQDGKLGPKAQHITWAISIIDGLRISLDKDSGGDIAQNLEALYDYMARRLVDANVKNDIALLDEVTSLLLEVKGAWDAIPEEAKNVLPTTTHK
jgi:flagellar protein FliS